VVSVSVIPAAQICSEKHAAGEDAMFSDLAVAHGTPVRRWTALVSFSLQAALVAAALVYPLLRLEPLPPLPHPVSLPVFGDFRPARPQTTVMQHSSGEVMIAPIIVSNRGTFFSHAAAPSQGGDTVGAPLDFGFVGSGVNISPIIGDYKPPIPTVAHHAQTGRTSVMMEGNLIRKVEPQYPSMARQLRVEGPVIIKAWINRDGLIERAQVESGHPLLIHAALEAVREWRYRPYYLNHEPVEVETEITVNFVLQK
jgi:periplasmic protein TonB